MLLSYYYFCLLDQYGSILLFPVNANFRGNHCLQKLGYPWASCCSTCGPSPCKYTSCKCSSSTSTGTTSTCHFKRAKCESFGPLSPSSCNSVSVDQFMWDSFNDALYSVEQGLPNMGSGAGAGAAGAAGAGTLEFLRNSQQVHLLIHT